MAAAAFVDHDAPFLGGSGVMVTGRMSSSKFGMAERRQDGTWRVLIDLPHVAFGSRYQTIGCTGVLDDFGQIVLVSRDDGSVVLS